MQRISDGRAVPKYQLETFTSKTTDASGEISLPLMYKPMSYLDVEVQIQPSTGKIRFADIDTVIVGTTITINVLKPYYYRAGAPGEKNMHAETESDVGSVGEAAEHSHTIPLVATNIALDLARNELQYPIKVHYKVA